MAQILLVDDDQDLIEMNRTVFAQRGHTVKVAYGKRRLQWPRYCWWMTIRTLSK